MTNGSTLPGLGASWKFASGYYPESTELAVTSPDASALSIVPVLFADNTDTSYNVTRTVRVPIRTVSNKPVTVTSSDVLKATSDDVHWFLIPIATGNHDLEISAAGMTKSAPLTTFFDPFHDIILSVKGLHTFPSVEVNYGTITPINVTVTNIGNQTENSLTIALSDKDSFSLSTENLSSLGVGEQANFTVVPKIGLPVKNEPYNATVTVKGSNDISKSFNVSFRPESTTDYRIELLDNDTREPIANSYTLRAIVDYGEPPSLTVIVKNTGNSDTGPLTVSLLGTNPKAFAVNGSPVASIKHNEEKTFSVEAAYRGLPIGTYTATVSVGNNNINPKTFDISFRVTQEPASYEGGGGGCAAGPEGAVLGAAGLAVFALLKKKRK
jgi:hypothetical protein